MNKFIKKIYVSALFFAAFFIVCIIYSFEFSNDIPTTVKENDTVFFALSYIDVNTLENDLDVFSKSARYNFILSSDDVITDKINIMIIIEMQNEHDIRLALELLKKDSLPANVVIVEPYPKKLMSDFSVGYKLNWGCYFISNAVSEQNLICDLNQTLLDFAFETGKVCNELYSVIGFYNTFNDKFLSDCKITFWQFGNGVNYVNSSSRNRIIRLNDLSIEDYFLSFAVNSQAVCP